MTLDTRALLCAPQDGTGFNLVAFPANQFGCQAPGTPLDRTPTGTTTCPHSLQKFEDLSSYVLEAVGCYR